MRAFVLIALAAALVSAEAIKWTGIAEDNQWYNHINWYPAQVPGQNDDVTINHGVVYCTQSTAVQSLTMGMEVGQTANLTVYKNFLVGSGGASIAQNGNFFVNTGLDQVFGQFTVGGTFNFIDGVLGGTYSITRGGFANLGNGNEKGFNGATFTSKGELTICGVLQLNQSSQIIIESNTVANCQQLIIQNGDNSAVLFDASAAKFAFSTGLLTIQAPVKLGDFTLQSGNITILDSLSFEHNLHVPKDSFVNAFGNAVVNSTAGLSGSGIVSAACKLWTFAQLNLAGALNLLGGAAVFSGASTVNIVTLKGSNIVVSAHLMASQLNLLTGTTTGSSAITAEKIWIQANGFTLGSTINVNGTATFGASSFTFGMDGNFHVMTGATAVVTAPVTLTGPAYIPGFTNNGKLQLSSSLQSQNIDVTGTGSVSVSSVFTVNTATVKQATITLASGASFSGQHANLAVGAVASATGGNVHAVIGDYSLTCKGECDDVKTGKTTPTSDFSFSA